MLLSQRLPANVIVLVTIHQNCQNDFQREELLGEANHIRKKIKLSENENSSEAIDTGTVINYNLSYQTPKLFVTLTFPKDFQVYAE